MSASMTLWAYWPSHLSTSMYFESEMLKGSIEIILPKYYTFINDTWYIQRMYLYTFIITDIRFTILRTCCGTTWRTWCRSCEHTLIYYNTDYRLEHWICDLDIDIDTTESIQEVRVCMLEYFLQCCPKDCTRKPLRRTNLLYIKFKLRGLNYQTPFYADCTVKYQKNYHKIYFLVDNSCNSEVISKSNILKQIL
jgi:hypothetical protein